ncbi:MAG: hypothetical protein GX820_00890 [Bacteroidales bacterium]|nr:hypothetical protein [Bacteroidales bacterium]
MKPLNKKERNKAILKVTGLFLITFIIAILVGFTTMNTATLSDKKSNTELKKLKDNLKFQEEIFGPNVNQATGLLTKLPKYKEEGENKEVLNQDIAALLSKTKNEIAPEETWETTMYKDVIQSLSNLQLAYNDQISLLEDLGQSGEVSKKLQECMAEKNQLQNQLNMIQASGGGGGGGGGGSNAAVAQLEKDLKDTQQKLRQCNLENRALKQEVEKMRSR